MQVLLAYNQAIASLMPIYEASEANAIAKVLIENIVQQKFSHHSTFLKKELTSQQIQIIEKYLHQLMNHRPVQYVLNEAWFFGLKFLVNESVLIPRQETEELVQIVYNHLKKFHVSDAVSVLDIGTGSGCIAISLKKNIPDLNVFAIDKSADALSIARQNATDNKTEIEFFELDILDQKQTKVLQHFDCIISNPPYVTESEKHSMEKHVLNFEPHSALFVPNNQALVFYDAIALFSKHHLNKNGWIFVEINAQYAKEVAEVFAKSNFGNIEIIKDMQGKNRFVKAQKN